MESELWLVFAVVTTAFWGVWGAFMEIPEKRGFPATLGYSVWSLTMIPCALVALQVIHWQLDYDWRSIGLGAAVGFLGAAGQLILFEALRKGPAYLVFPVISLSPVVTVLLSVLFLHETAKLQNWVGIGIALVAIILLSYQPRGNSIAKGYLWFVLAFFVFLMWGIQAFVMRFANASMRAESIFFYMMVTGLMLIPIALWMTDFSKPVNWGFHGPYLSALIQVLNAIGALCLVYAFRYGKAIIVSPLTNALAPVLTIIISLIIYRVLPHRVTMAGMLLAAISFYLMAV
jgi:uncharacterized membrane protein